MKITIQLRQQYGEWRAYPACPDSRIFANMLGTKTLTDTTLTHIRRLGYAIEMTHPHVSMMEFVR